MPPDLPEVGRRGWVAGSEPHCASCAPTGLPRSRAHLLRDWHLRDTLALVLLFSGANYGVFATLIVGLIWLWLTNVSVLARRGVRARVGPTSLIGARIAKGA